MSMSDANPFRTPAQEALHYLEAVIIPNISLIIDKDERARVIGEYKKAMDAAHESVDTGA